MASKVLFIIGGGPRIGHSVAKKFLLEGYQVAIGRRNIQETAKNAELEGALPVYLDVTKPDAVEAAFREVESKLGPPNVVVYNAAALSMPSDVGDPFGVPVKTFEQDLAINATSAYAALFHATQGFRAHQNKYKAAHDSPCVYIATGNVTPFLANSAAVTLGSGKAALAYLISIGASSYKDSGFRYYFASQVTADGGPVPYPDVDGDAHGGFYWQVVNGVMGSRGWDLRFVVNSDGSVAERE